MQESCGDSVRPIFLRVLVSLSNQCLRLCCSPYNLFLGIHNWLVWLNGQPMGGLMMMVSLSGNVAFQKQFLYLPFLNHHVFSMIMVFRWQRYDYEMTGENFLFFSQYKSLLLSITNIQLLTICGSMSYSHFTMRHNIEGVVMVGPFSLIFLLFYRYGLPCFHPS